MSGRFCSQKGIGNNEKKGEKTEQKGKGNPAVLGRKTRSSAKFSYEGTENTNSPLVSGKATKWIANSTG